MYSNDGHGFQHRESNPSSQGHTSAADASKKLYAVSRKAKSSSNDSDRLTKYLARFGLKFRPIINADRV